MALWTALSRRRRKIPAINNPTAGLRLTQDLSKTKTTQILGCYIWPRAGATGGREGASPPHSDYPAPSLKMSVKIDFIYEI